jgi:hypothetical protein
MLWTKKIERNLMICLPLLYYIILPAFILPDFLLTGLEITTLSGMPAYSTRFIGYVGEGVKAVQITLLIHDGKLYVLTYFAPLQAFANYLLAANRMTDSFEIIQ